MNHVRGFPARILDALRQPLEVRSNRVSEFRQGGSRGAAVEQRSAEFPLQPLDRVGQGRLRHTAGLCGDREILFATEGEEVPDLMRFHGAAPTGFVVTRARNPRAFSSRDTGVT
jgi:hypothetical protein